MEVRKTKAERLGFEPRRPCGPHAFQACSLSQLGHLSGFNIKAKYDLAGYIYNQQKSSNFCPDEF
jgi:hypothetical protein